jgi:hypothetical protein
MLQRQTISLPLAQGVDTKTDSKQVEAGKLLELENGVFTKLKSIQKRHGNVSVGTGILGSVDSTVSNGVGLAQYANELLLGNGTRLYSYDQSNDAWVDKSAYTPVQVSKFSVVNDNHSQTYPDGATHFSGLQLYAWQDSSAANSIRYSVLDGQTNQTIVSSALLSANASRPRVIALGSSFAVYFVDTVTSELKLASVLVADPLAAPVINTLTSTGVSNNALDTLKPFYDVCLFTTPNQPTIALVFNNNNAGATVRVYQYQSPTVPVVGVTQFVIPATASALSVFSNNLEPLYSSPCGPVVLFREDLTGDVYFSAYTNDLVLIDGNTLFNSMNDVQLTGCSNSSGPGFVVYVEDEADTTIAQCFVNDSYVQQTPNMTFQVNARLLGRAFKINGMSYVPVVFYSAPILNATAGDVKLQSAAFVLDENANIIVRALMDTATYRSAFTGLSTILPDVVPYNEYGYRLVVAEAALLEGSLNVAQTNVSVLNFVFGDPTQSIFHEQLANNLHLSGGMLQMYDGVSVVEHGFHRYPTVTNLINAAAGSLSGGTYYYTACYEWTDNQGNIHQSAPADPIKITLPASRQTTMSIPYLNFTAKDNVRLVVYRTLKDEVILYQASSLTAPDYNSKTNTFLTYTDNLSDSSLRTRPQLYTQPLDLTAAPEVDNFPAPATNLIQLHRNRLWVVDSTSPLNIWYSKLTGPETPVAFNDGFVKQIDPRGGNITALSTIDDKLLVFKQNHIFFVVGQGPTNTDQNNDLSDSILVTTDCGCIDQRSIVATPVGLLFQSRKGIYLIDRSLAVQYIGAPVEAYNGQIITSSVLVADTNQVRFTLGSGVSLVYDYLVGQWGVFTNQNAKDSTIWQNTQILLRTNGTIWRETPGVYTDAGQPIRLKLTTSWFSFANMQGFQRVRRAQVLGAWKSAHQLKVTVYNDFNDTAMQEMVITPATPDVYGDGVYGAEAVYGGEFQLYQWRVDLAKQKTQSVKFTLEDLPAATAGEGMGLSSIAFEVGAKVGLAKTPASQIVS